MLILRLEALMPVARPYGKTQADREFDDALRRIRIVYRREDGSTDWDRFYEDARKRREASQAENPAESEKEDQDVRNGTDPA
jgi:hypothetical protein